MLDFDELRTYRKSGTLQTSRLPWDIISTVAHTHACRSETDRGYRDCRLHDMGESDRGEYLHMGLV